MITTPSIRRVRGIVRREKRKGRIVGFVPTMGALHKGHLSLVKAAKKDTDFVVASIFINPTQFSQGEDYKTYPRDFKKDEYLLKREGVNVVFYPRVTTMYADAFSTYVEEKSLSKYLCGALRPDHFRGVCTVVVKMFNIVSPDISYFGQKDYQQTQIIKRMVRDLDFTTKIKILPILREKDGLAMSSRNNYLNGEERRKAVCLYHALKLASKKIKEGERSVATIIKLMRRLIKKEVPFAKVEYINIVSSDTLENVKVIEGKVLVALAVYIGRARLIDNILIMPKVR